MYQSPVLYYCKPPSGLMLCKSLKKDILRLNHQMKKPPATSDLKLTSCLVKEKNRQRFIHLLDHQLAHLRAMSYYSSSHHASNQKYLFPYFISNFILLIPSQITFNLTHNLSSTLFNTHSEKISERLECSHQYCILGSFA